MSGIQDHPPPQNPMDQHQQNTTSAHNNESAGEDSEDESEILEESPCGRWLKRREEVEQRDVPGIDSAFLAMDTEEGVEVVWNEVQFSERKNFKAQEEKIQTVFENLTQLEHPNIVKFHRYWTDTHNDKPRVIFITEYMSSGSLKQFLKRTKRNVKKLPLSAWKRWCSQILSALSYLHSCSPPIIHGNLTCDTIFIQHNGLVKIGCVAPDTIHHHVKTCRDNMKNMHFIAPEYGANVSTAIDIYAFGMCALEMAALEIQGNGDSGTLVTEDHIKATIESLDDASQKDFIYTCLSRESNKRPTAAQLLFHPVLFEVHALKLLSAHALVRHCSEKKCESITDEILARMPRPETVLADMPLPSSCPLPSTSIPDDHFDTTSSSEGDSVRYVFRMSHVHSTEKLEKFVEDVKYGIYPLTSYKAKKPPIIRPRAISPEQSDSARSGTPEPFEIESRKVVNMMCNLKPKEHTNELMILLRMNDKMNRQLTCNISDADQGDALSQELVHFGFINETDREKLSLLIQETLSDPVLSSGNLSKSASSVLTTNSSSTTTPSLPASYAATLLAPPPTSPHPSHHHLQPVSPHH
uniref:Nuclear receptor-binding protein homolog n=1 Tax=Cacopsylla melanoneura TaxID=428564 RepID=A0A8D8QG91_9HEMI